MVEIILIFNAHPHPPSSPEHSEPLAPKVCDLAPVGWGCHSLPIDVNDSQKIVAFQKKTTRRGLQHAAAFHITGWKPNGSPADKHSTLTTAVCSRCRFIQEKKHSSIWEHKSIVSV